MDAARELERLRKLVEASYELHSSLELDELLGLILATARDGVGADRGTVFVLEGDELWSRVLSGDETLEIRLPLGQGIAGTVARTGRAVRIADAYGDGRFDRSWDERSGYRTRQILCAPIRSRAGAVAGVFQLLNKEGGFQEADEEYLAALSVHAALAIENAKLHSSALERERFDREVQLAQEVQRQLQPERKQLTVQSVTAAGMNELCEDASGDYYDLIVELPGGKLGVVVGDVSGHGLQAALVMAETRAYLRAFVRTTDALPRALDLLNDHLVPDLAGGKFVSLFAAVVDAATGEVEWCNAGHNPPWLLRAGGELTPLTRTGRVLGVLPDAGYGRGEPFTLQPGDVVLLYTDGITEARAPDGELFGPERLSATLTAEARAEPAAILDRVRAAVKRWTGGASIEDDVTMLVLKRVPNPRESD